MNETITWETIRDGASRLRELHASAALLQRQRQFGDENSQSIVTNAIKALHELSEGRQMEIESFMEPIILLSNLLGQKKLQNLKYFFDLLIFDLLEQFQDACLELRETWIPETTPTRT